MDFPPYWPDQREGTGIMVVLQYITELVMKNIGSFANDDKDGHTETPKYGESADVSGDAAG